MSGLYRSFESKLDFLLGHFPAVIITGVRQCGKTTLAKQMRPDWHYYDFEKGSDYDYITRDFDLFFSENPQHIIFDESQYCPELFRELRGVIDADRKQNNRFILTGSSSFELLNQVSESLAGRVAIIELGPFKASEFYQKDLPSFYQIFQDKIDTKSLSFLKNIKPKLSHQEIKHFFLKGGYPEPSLNKNSDFYKAWMDNYFQTYIQRDIRKLYPKLDIIKYRRFISMLSSLSGALINKSELGRSLNTSEVTISDYLDIANGTFLWRNIPSYENSTSKSIIKMPKGIFRDSGLSHHLNSIYKIEDLNRYPRVGSNFEAFVIEEIIKGLNASMFSSWNYYYFRTKNGAEVDLILTGEFGIIPIEIKYGMKTTLRDLTSLSNFIKNNNAPFGLLINNSAEVRMLSENIIQIPVGMI